MAGDVQEPELAATSRTVRDVPAADVRAAVEKALSSTAFNFSERLSRLLRYLVEQTLAGRTDRLKEYALGVDVLGRSDSFDPRTDSIVRVEASRLRAKLAAYYRSEGIHDPVRIELPRGSYVPVFHAVQRNGESRRLVARWKLVIPAAAVLIAAASGAWIAAGHWLRTSDPAGPPPASIAVLPFANLNRDKETEYFSAGIGTEIMGTLARIPGLRVVARSSASQYKGRNLDVRRIGAELNVSAVVEGSVRKDGNRWRITAELVNVEDGFQLWSRAYEARAEQISAIQGEIARDIAAALRVPLVNEGSALGWKRRTGNAEAHNLVLRARYLDPTAVDTAAARIGHYKQAIALDPGYADAWVGLADTWMRLAGAAVVPPRQVMEQAREAVEKSRKLDESLPDARFLAAMLAWYYDWDWEAADRNFRRAIELDPSSASHRSFYAQYLATMGRGREALEQLDTVRLLEPLAGVRSVEAAVYYFNRDFERTLRYCRDALADDPGAGPLLYWMGRAYGSLGMRAQSLQALEQSHGPYGVIQPRGFGMLAVAYARTGRRQDALRLLARVMEKAKQSYVSPISVAQIYMGLGDHKTTLEWLEKAYQDRDFAMPTLGREPAYDPLRQEPAFITLLNRMNLP